MDNYSKYLQYSRRRRENLHNSKDLLFIDICTRVYIQKIHKDRKNADIEFKLINQLLHTSEII